MGAGYYFDFLGTVWDHLPSEDRQRYAELWRGYEQVFADFYQKINESDLNIIVKYLRPWEGLRWLPYTFNDETFINVNATYTSTQDISLGISTVNKYLLRLSYDDETPFEVDISGEDKINTNINEVVEKINNKAGFRFCKAVLQNSTLQLVSPTAGVDSKVKVWPTSIASANAAEFLMGLLIGSEPEVFPEYPYIYSLPYDNVVEIPKLRDKIRDENITVELKSGSDYILKNRATISFREEPPVKMWAKLTNTDSENPWYNYGWLMDIYQPNSARYVKTLQGLWFAFWTGPRPLNLKRALYLLFGLPTASEKGTVTSVSPTTIKITGVSGNIHEYAIPDGLLATVVTGQAVGKFDTLVTGIDIYDKTNRPNFIRNEIGRIGIQRFLTENATSGSDPDTDESKALDWLEEHTFLPQISVESFINPDINLGNVRIFLDAIKPLSKAYLFQVIVGEFQDDVGIDESAIIERDFDVSQNLDWNITKLVEQSTLIEYETMNNSGMDLDLDGVSFNESTEVEVFDHGILIDSFTV